MVTRSTSLKLRLLKDKATFQTLQTWIGHNEALKKYHTFVKKCQNIICQGLSWVVFKWKLLNFLYDPDWWSWDFEVEFFPLQSDIPITLLCLIVRLGPISRVLVVLQKANNVVVRCHFCKTSRITIHFLSVYHGLGLFAMRYHALPSNL